MTNTTDTVDPIVGAIDDAITLLREALERAEKNADEEKSHYMAGYFQGKIIGFNHALDIVTQLKWVADR